MKRSLFFLTLIAALLVSFIKFPKLKDLQKAQETLETVSKSVRPITEEEEFYIGRSVAANILGSYPVWKNKPVTRYVNLVGQSLVICSDRPETFGGYHFAVLDTAEINAFSAPGGIVMITRGLLKLCAGEDELAAVLAHEICHIVAKDPTKAIKSERMKGLAAFTAAEITKADDKVVKLFQNTVVDITGTLLQKGYSRSQEKDADLNALRLMAAAGYDPAALLAMLKKIESGEVKKAKAFSAHPPAGDRVEYVAKAKVARRGTGAEARAARFKANIGNALN